MRSTRSWKTKTSKVTPGAAGRRSIGAWRTLPLLLLALGPPAPGGAGGTHDDHPGRSHTVGAARLFVETEGSGPPLVLLPAGPGLDHRYFHPYLTSLAPYATVVYLDPRGCGLSARQPGADYSVEAMVADLEDVRRELGYETIDILGHGLGQAVGTLYADRHPQRVGRMIVIGAGRRAASFTDSPGLLEALAALPGNRYLSEDGRLRKRLRVLAPLMFHRLTDRSFHNAFAGLITTSADVHDAIAAGLSRGPVDLSAALGRLKVPLLIVAGRHDPTATVAEAEEVRGAVPGARLVVLEESGAFPFAEQPVDFLKAVREFLTGGLEGKNAGAGGGI
jgi:proline iminopeptidase